MNTSVQKQNILNRLWVYQKERFPVIQHGMLIASFSFCAVCLSSLLRFSQAWPDLQITLTAFGCLFLFFLQLRIADEFKDHENDAKFRPERPVPRGLITFNELKWLGMISAGIQVLLCLLLYPPLILLLFAVWVYMALMSVEFFVPTWLKQHSFIYLWTHMLIMPAIDLFATGCDWLQHQAVPPEGLLWFLIVSFFNGVVIEIGRKTWAPEEERVGVESYSSDWGIKPAIAVWIAAILLSFVCACVVAMTLSFFVPVFSLLLVMVVVVVMLGIRFMQNPSKQKSKWLENASALWVASLYLILGVIPMGYSVWLN